MANNIVVIIDDDEDLLRLLTFAFTAKGFEIRGFVNGREALLYLREEKNLQTACLLVLDRMLPDMDGLDILKELQIGHFPLPVLILSALSAEKDVLHGLKEGAVDYITKPFSIPILLQKALALIQNHPL